jgi:hypothetical protein
MLDKNTLVKVTNRDNGRVGYTIPDLNLYRQYQAGETKEITMEELRKLSYVPGGYDILQNCLLIQNEEARAELFPSVEPEYYYTAEDVKRLLTTGSLDELLDCLDFAPEGVIDLVKQYAVDLKINDLSKREAILKKTGFNVTTAININKETDEESKAAAPTRRVSTTSTSDTDESKGGTSRRTSPKYKVVG